MQDLFVVNQKEDYSFPSFVTKSTAILSFADNSSNRLLSSISISKAASCMRTNRSSSVSSLFLSHALGGSFFIVEADVYGDVAAIVAETAAEEGQAAAAAAAGDI